MTADSTGILIMNLLISLGGVLLSFWVANYRGELAAAKYAQSETKRREHERILITNPINQLWTYLYDINGILYKRYQNIDIHKLRSPDAEFFYEHLKTGYPKLMQTINRYEDSYNRSVNQINSIFQSASDILEKKWGDAPKHNIIAPQLKSEINKIIGHFSEEAANRLINNTEPKFARAHPQDPDTILVGSAHIIIHSMIDRRKVANDLNLILESSEVFGELQQVWETAKSQSEVHSQIHYELQLIRSLVYAGVTLKGSCEACM